MSQAGFSKILIYKSDTATSVPIAANLTNSATGAELAVNTADQRLFTKNAGGSVVELGTNPSTLTLPNGTANGVLYLNGSKAATSGSGLYTDGSRLGIGTVSFPAGQRLRVAGGDVGFEGQYFYLLNADANIQMGAAQNAQIINSDTGNLLTFSRTGASSAMAFSTAGSEAMRITNAQNVGIGTSSPAAKLDVVGAIRATTNISAVQDFRLNNASFFRVADASPGGFVGGYNIKSDGGTGAVYDSTGTTGGYGVYLGTLTWYTGTSASAGTAAPERMRLDTSGNLGIGTTPSAWRSGARAFQSGANKYVSLWEQANGSTNLGFAVYEGASNTFNYTTTGDAPTLYSQINGTHKWFYAGSGTAGNAISFTQAMTLDGSGNLGLGTTSPTTVASKNLQVFAGAGLSSVVRVTGNNGTGVDFLQDASGIGYVFQRDNQPLVFGTNNTERARISSGGSWLVGTTSYLVSSTEKASFDCGATNGVASKTSGGSASWNYFAWNSATSGNNGFIEFGTEGTYTARGSITYNRGAGQVAYNITSDARLKENIADSVDAGGKIDAMQVRQFDWKETGNHLDYGFVAQELHDVAPHAVSKPENEEAMWSVDYSKLVPMLVKEVQSLRKRVAELEAK